MSQQNNHIHYHIDGDVLFVVEDTKFLVHKNIIGLASKCFYDMFTCATPNYSTQNDSENTPVVFLDKFPEYKRKDIFSQLSLYSHTVLTKKYNAYTDSLAKLANVDFTSEFIERSKQVQILPLPLPPTPPSATRKFYLIVSILPFTFTLNWVNEGEDYIQESKRIFISTQEVLEI
ncbi:unnamed protein product [Rhizophagus irregularis]|nr:unnamed protein product [Rhizophagus irregularis]